MISFLKLGSFSCFCHYGSLHENRMISKSGGNKMKRKTTLISLCIVAAIIISCGIYIFAGTKKAEKLMWKHLDDKGYKQTEIKSVDVNHSFLNVILSYNEWNIKVVYTDEPTSVYSYHMKKGQIVEGGVSGTTDKEDLKH